tara:strand:- start:1491 stop:1997 length:507 start_codon:yes stop_codon:yes gene_type:complete
MQYNKLAIPDKITLCYGIIPVILTDGEFNKCITVMQHNCLSFPKGHLEIGETDIECAKREFYEETHIDLEFLKILDNEPTISISYITRKYNVEFKIIKFYLAIIDLEKLYHKHNCDIELIKKEDKDSLGIKLIDLNNDYINNRHIKLNYHMKKKIPYINQIIKNYLKK